jgi:hypothetical protein
MTTTHNNTTDEDVDSALRSTVNQALCNTSTANSNRLCRLSATGCVFSLFTLFETRKKLTDLSA